MNPKVLVLGLDGATWKVLLPLIKMDKLPTLAKIINKGVYGNLVSTFPPATGPAWLSMATGKNPGKTGVYDFLTRKGMDFSTKVINSFDYRKNNPYWDLLNKKGYKTYLLNYPMLYPFYEIDGAMVGGMGTPEKRGIAFPASLEKQLSDLTDRFWTTVDWHSPKYCDKKKFVRDLHIFIEKQFRVVKYLIRDDWNFFLHVSSASDFLQHVMWKDWNDVTSKYHQDFISVWEKLDQNIGSILENIVNTNVFIVSDHGFGLLKENFNLSKWLLEKGFLKKNSTYKTRKSLVTLLDFVYNKFENFPLKKYLASERFKSSFFAKTFNVGYPFPPEVNVSDSKIIPGYSSGAYGALHIMDPVNDYEKVREEAIQELKKLEKVYGLSLEIFKREELYWGDKSNQAPDLMFKINDHQCNIQASTLKGEIFSDNLPFKNKSGSHRGEGIFCAFGPDIIEGKKINAKIYDLAPTILHIFGVPIPNDIDGRVLKEIFREDSEIAKRKPNYSNPNYYDKKRENEKLKKVIRNLKLKEKI